MQAETHTDERWSDTGPMKHVNLRLPDDLHAEVKAAAEGDARSLNSMLAVLLKEALAARKAAAKKATGRKS